MTMRRLFLSGAAILLFGLASACGGEGDIGDSCGTSGVKDGECTDGAICGDPGDGTLACLKLCVDQTECAAGQDCNGIAGTNEKGCRTTK